MPVTKINGLDPAECPPIAFVDLDGVVFEEGTDRLRAGAKDRLAQLSRTHRIVLFTSRSQGGSWVPVLLATGVPILGFIQKPLGCAYVYFDDRLNAEQCFHELPPAPLAPHNTLTWQALADEATALGCTEDELRAP